MAFLLILYVPYEPDENKLVREIKERSAANSAEPDEEVKETDGDGGETDTEDVEDKSKDHHSSSDNSTDEESDVAKTKEPNKVAESADETSLKATDDEEKGKKPEDDKWDFDESGSNDSDDSKKVGVAVTSPKKVDAVVTSHENVDVAFTSPEKVDDAGNEAVTFPKKVDVAVTSSEKVDVAVTSPVKVNNVAVPSPVKVNNVAVISTEKLQENEVAVTGDTRPELGIGVDSEQSEHADVKAEQKSGDETKETDGEDSKSEDKSDNDDANSSQADDKEKEIIDLALDKDLTPLMPALPLYKSVQNALIDLDVENWDRTMIGNQTTVKYTFIQTDSMRCELVLKKLKSLGVGKVAGSSISVVPASLHESGAETRETTPEKEYVPNEDFLKKESMFKKSIKSRLVVDQVVASVRSNAMFTFDYLLLLILASLISCLGLVENSSVVLVASMLISPLMGPILAGTFGQVIQNKELRNLGVKSELAGLILCLVVGFVFGLISGFIGLKGALWGSTDAWPTIEMKSRGLLRSLWVGVLIALPSGAGVAISVLGGNAGSLVGVAISASLLPPACNAGVLWAYALLATISPPDVVYNLPITTATSAPVNMTTLDFNSTSDLNSTTSIPLTTAVPALATYTAVLDCLPLVNNAYTQVYSCNVATDAALLGLVSFGLTILNIACILIMGILVLKIKEVAPTKDHFWHEDIKVARNYYHTSKGGESKTLGKQFLEEWRRIKESEKQKKLAKAKAKEAKDDDDYSDDDSDDDSDEDSRSLSNQMETINIINFISGVENSPGIQHIVSRLSPAAPHENVTAGLSYDYNRAQMDLEQRLSQRPSVYLMEPKVKDKIVSKTYHTIHGRTDKENTRPTLGELRHRLTSRPKTAYFDPAALEVISETNSSQEHSRSETNLPHPSKSGLWRRRKKEVKFQVTKVEEIPLLP